MRKTHLVTVAAVLMFASAGVAAATIVGTKHDMVNSTYDNTGNSTAKAVCVYCHTPHKAQGTGGPIWNRQAGSNSYTTYGTTMANTTASTTLGAESLACLGCHDGTVAIDSIYNAPGSGTWTTNDKKILSNSFAYVGTDLSDDHPVSITYTEGLAGLKAAGDIGMPLYGTSDNQVECATCHSVHDDTKGSFLRVTQTDSDICTACHNR